MSLIKEFTKGIIKENPVLVLALGLCPTLAVSTTIVNGIGMGIAATFVLVCSNMVISLIKNLVPNRIRIPIFITVIATFVTIVKLAMAAYFPALSKSLGIFIPLIVVNCIILGRAEGFASKHGVLKSFIDGLGMGVGFTMILVILGTCREILGSGTILGHPLFGEHFKPALLMILPPGGFFSIGILIALSNLLQKRLE
ncbi:electron transport complex subunit E [bacterium]|nr:electron transport complex subunit E [bacterium]